MAAKHGYLTKRNCQKLIIAKMRFLRYHSLRQDKKCRHTEQIKSTNK